MSRRRTSSRSIFHTAVGPERRVVESPDIEPRTAAQPGFNDEGGVDSPWGDLAYVVQNPNDAWVDDGLTGDERIRQYVDSLPDDEKMTLPEAWLDGAHQGARDRELVAREATILKAMAKANLSEQRELLAELNGIRAEKTARIAARRELDLANAVVADHLTPIVSTGSRSTAKSDWLDDVPALTPRDMGHDVIVEAAMFWRDLHTAVKADVEELVEQASGRARVVASRFEGQAPAARRMFMEEIVRLAAAHPAQEPAADGVATSTLPVAVNPSDAPETFDQDTLSDADREAIHDSQMADSDFAQKYQSKSSLVTAINDTMWAKLGGFETEDDDDYDAAENEAQSKNDDTKDEDAAEDTSGDEDEGDDSGKPWEKKDASRRTAAEMKRIDGRPTYKAPGDLWAADASDNGPAFMGYDANCSMCWLGYGHTVRYHEKALAEAGPGPRPDDPQFAPGGQGTWSSLRPRKTAGAVLDLCHQIVANKQAQDVNGVLLDMQTANAIVQVYSALSPQNQAGWEKLVESKPLDWVAEKAWSLLGSTGATASHTAGAPTIKGPDQDLKNAPQAEQNAYWNWVGQMSADSDSGYYVPLNFKAWRGSYWDDSKSNTTYAPGMPPMASSRRTAVSLTRVGLDGENGIGTDPQGNRVRFRLTPKERQDLASVLFSDMSVNFSGVDVDESDIIREGARRTAADEPAKDGAAESTLPVAINPSDAPEGLDQLNESPQPATGMVGEGSGPAAQAAAAGGPTTFNDFVKDHSKAAAFRARVQANLQASRRPFEGASRTAMPNPVDLGVKVGDIFESTWGYDQTNVDYYEVVGLTGASVKVRQIASTTARDTGLWAQRYVKPVPGQFIGEVMTKRIQEGWNGGTPTFTVNSYATAYLWDGTPTLETSYA